MLTIEERIDMNDLELIKFFSKYNYIQLEAFNILFDFIREEEFMNAIKIVKDIYTDKVNNLTKEKYYEFYNNRNFRASCITSENNRLTNKELNFLYNLVDIVSDRLSSIHHINVYDERIDFWELGECMIDEIDKRNSVKAKVLKK